MILLYLVEANANVVGASIPYTKIPLMTNIKNQAHFLTGEICLFFMRAGQVSLQRNYMVERLFNGKKKTVG